MPALVALACSCLARAAKDASLNAIELYDGTSGPAYIQLADVSINGKIELRDCGSPAPRTVEKSAYGKMSKITISPGGTLERDADGVLRYTVGRTATCVVPENVRFAHGSSVAPAEIADEVELRARPIAPGTDGAAVVQPLKRGVTLVFVAAPDMERAEYLLAERMGTQSGWQKYLGSYPTAQHSSAARQALASLYAKAGESAFRAYEKTASGASPSYADLKHAAALMAQTHALLPNSAAELKLSEEIEGSLSKLAANEESQLKEYKSSLSSSSPGYAHLVRAREYYDAIVQVDPAFAALARLKSELMGEVNTFEAALRAANSAVSKKEWDEALGAVQPYRQFAGEEPRVASVIDAVYSANFVQGQEMDAVKDWEKAMAAYREAVKARQTPEATDSLKAAEKEYAAAQDEVTAKAALEKSRTYESQNDMIPAFEVLTGLSQSQQTIVKDDIARLAPEYAAAALQKAKEIARAYDSIKGLGDEKAVESAYNYLQRADEVTDDAALKQNLEMRMQNLGEELSAWFLDRAKHSLQKPLGSGTEIGWAYLKQAEMYKASNLEAVRDQMKMAAVAHQMHSRLSIRVQFRDQTSQRQSEGFANQMESAIAAGLDTSGMAVKVIRSGDTIPPDVNPDFVIAGDVLEHNISFVPTVESLDSKYLAGTHEVPNDEWNAANRQYASSMDELQSARAALQGAEAKGNKKAIAAETQRVTDAEKKTDELRTKLDAIPRTHTEDVTRSYSYQKTTYAMVNRIVLQFRMDDAFSGQKGEPVQVSKEERNQFVVIGGVKAEDTNRIKNEGTVPDKEVLQNELENTARADLIAKVHEKVIELPRAIYDSAQKKEQEGYPDDAAEAYMRYLSVASGDRTAERDHAEKFLREQFNFQTFPKDNLPNPRPSPPLEQGMARPGTSTGN